MCFLRVFKKFLKVVRVGKKWSEGVKNGGKWGKKLVPISAFIHYSRKENGTAEGSNQRSPCAKLHIGSHSDLLVPSFI